MDRDFRVRAFLYIKKEGTALGLYNHVMGAYGDAVDINLGTPYAEPRLVEIGNHWIVEYDLAFSPEKQEVARGLFNHTKNIAENHATPSPEGFNEGFVSIERCGHRIKQGCSLIERYEVE